LRHGSVCRGTIAGLEALRPSGAGALALHPAFGGEPLGTAAPVAPPTRIDLERSYALCRENARVHSKTFYFASLFLSYEKRRAIWAAYAFCRIADDYVDTLSPPAQRLAALDAWEHELREAYAGRAQHPHLIAFADAAERFSIPIEPALDLLRGARRDITIRRYQTYDELREYCYLVASTVGLLTAPILGYREGALEYGIALGRAMQMTNILRDVGEDARMDRVYLPAEDLRRFGCSEENILNGVLDDGFVALMKFQIERVRGMYAEAEPGIALLSPESRYTVRLALSLYRRILDRIEHNGYDVFSRRAFVPIRTKLSVALATAMLRPANLPGK
jgi:phytoene synthase